MDDAKTLGVTQSSASTDVDDRAKFLDTDEHTTDDTSTKLIPIVEEELNVGKRDVETGKVRVRSRIIETPVEQTVRLREEHVNVERTPTNRPATKSDFATTQENEIEITTTAEIPVIQK